MADSPSHNKSAQTTVFIASTHRLPPARDDSPQSFYKHTTHISYHSGETLRSVRHPRFQPPPARHDRATVLASPNPDSTLSRSRGPSSIQVPSNRRQQTILVFQAIDESTKSSSSKQSTTAQSLRLPSNRRAFLHQHTERRAATRQRQLAASTADHARTNHTHWLSQCTLVRSHCTHACATHSPYKHKLQENCMPVSRTNSLSLLNGNQRKKKKKKKKKEPHTHHTNTNYTKRENVRVSRLNSRKKYLVYLQVQCLSLKIKKRKKKKMFRSSLLSVLHPK